MAWAEVRALALALSQCVFIEVCASDCGLRLQQAVDLTLLGSSQRIQLSPAARGNCIPERTAKENKATGCINLAHTSYSEEKGLVNKTQ